MNRKEAEEIVVHPFSEAVIAQLGKWGKDLYLYGLAKGFLEGSNSERARAKVLVNAIENSIDCIQVEEEVGELIMCDQHLKELKEALQKYRDTSND